MGGLLLIRHGETEWSRSPGCEGVTTVEIRRRRPDRYLWTDGVAAGSAEQPGGTSEQVGARADRVLARVDSAARGAFGVEHGRWVVTAWNLPARTARSSAEAAGLPSLQGVAA